MRPLMPFFLIISLISPVNAAFIEQFGAKPNTGTDQTESLLKAFHAAAEARGMVLNFASGKYDVAIRQLPPDGTSGPVLSIKDVQGLTIDGHGAELVCHDFATLFAFENCRGITIRNLNIDYDPLPFTAGQIVALGNGTLDLKIESHHPVQAGFRVESLLPYDVEHHRMGLLKEDLYQPNQQQRAEKIGDHLLRIPVIKQLFKVGDWVILRHQIYGKNAFNFVDCRQITLENVTVYTCPGMALHAQGGEDFSLQEFNVLPKPSTGRWFSATADATHFNGTRGKVTLENCQLQAMGDDGANVHNWYLIVTEVVDAKTFKCILGKDKTWEPPIPRDGDSLEIASAANPLMLKLKAKVASTHLESDAKDVLITLTSAPNETIAVGDVVGDASALPTLEVRACTIGHNRARGVLVQTRGATVENCDFQDISGAAIQVTCDAHQWWEGMSAQNVLIRNNKIARVNFGIGSRDAAIDIFAETKTGPADPVHHQIEILDNTFANITGAAIHVGSASAVTIRQNTFDSEKEPAVIIDHSRDVRVTENRGFADRVQN